MSAWQTFSVGWRRMQEARSWRLVSVFFGLYLVAGAALAAPMYAELETWAGGNAFAGEMLQGFDHLWATDFRFWRAGFIETFRQAVVWAAILFAIFQAALVAGALEVLRDEPNAGGWLSPFRRGCARHLGPFLRLVALGAVLYWLAFLLLNDLGAQLIERVTRNLLPEWPLLALTWARVALLLAVLFAINLTLDYARVRIVTEDRSSALLALIGAAGFVRSQFNCAAGAYTLWGLAALALTLLYLFLASLIPQSSLATMALWFAVAQTYLFFRLWMRLGFYASATALVSRLASKGGTSATPQARPRSTDEEPVTESNLRQET